MKLVNVCNFTRLLCLALIMMSFDITIFISLMHFFQHVFMEYLSLTNTFFVSLFISVVFYAYLMSRAKLRYKIMNGGK